MEYIENRIQTEEAPNDNFVDMIHRVWISASTKLVKIRQKQPYLRTSSYAHIDFGQYFFQIVFT